MKPDNLILNIDECTIERGWSAAYSWSKIGINQKWQNIRVYGSLKVIFSNCIKWMMVCFSSPNPILIQNNFALYWKHLAEWLDYNSNFGFKNVVVILDNCSSHRAKTTVDYLKRRNLSIYFLILLFLNWLLWNLPSTTSSLI